MQDAPTQSRQTSSNVTSQPEYSISDQPCYLLELPAELRNHIYELVLVSPTRITVKKKYKRPGILAVNHQTRSEAWKIYFNTENTFRFIIHSCDGNLFMKWVKVFPTFDTDIYFQDQGTPNFANLYNWLQEAHETLFSLPQNLNRLTGSGADATHTVVWAAHRIMGRAIERREWPDDVVPILAAFYHAISALDNTWALRVNNGDLGRN